MTRFRWVTVVTACAGVALAGCGVGGGPASSPESGQLRGTKIPSTFEFATTHGVDLTLKADKALYNGRSVAGVEVSSSDKGIVYRGPIRPGQALPVHLVLPTKDKSVSVTFRTQGVEKTAALAITNHAAAHTFQ